MIGRPGNAGSPLGHEWCLKHKGSEVDCKSPNPLSSSLRRIIRGYYADEPLTLAFSTAMSKTTRATAALDRAGVSYTVHAYDYDPDAARIGLQRPRAWASPLKEC